MSTPATASVEKQRENLKALQRLLAVRKAQESLLGFMRLTMPDPNDPDDVVLSQYETTPLSRLLCDIFEKIARGGLKRAAVSASPQHGKSAVTSRGAPAWIAGKFPKKNIILATYSQDFAEEFGGDVRNIMLSPQFKQVFPNYEFRKGDRAKGLLVSKEGGRLMFVGRESGATGKPADLIIVDDPIKDDKEAQSPTIQKQVWNWFTKVIMTRAHKNTVIVVVHTRWSQDDLIGRLCDPDHPDYDAVLAGLWERINIPAVVWEPKLAAALGLTLESQTDPLIVSQFGDRPISALWPERHDLFGLAVKKKTDPTGFSALYMGAPSPEDGDYFKRDWIVPYKPHELPKNLIKYGASDHALSEEQDRDKTCMGVCGVDPDGEIWLLPDLYWERENNTSVVVDVMIEKILLHRPQIWWAEQEAIGKSILPFLRKRMIEEKAMFTLIDDSAKPSKKKRVRARPLQGMMALHRVHFPTFAPWWAEAQAELLKFDNAAHDDFVDMLAWIGTGLMREVPATRERAPDKVITVGSIAWIKAQSAREQRRDERMKFARGM